MTKIKNTKKGMAKKTLSISLAVAMLATSNVPVWAAEDLFTDGDVAVEAFTAEETVEVEAPAVEEEVVEAAEDSVSNPASTITISQKGWANNVKLNDGKVYDKDGNEVRSFAYAWYVNGLTSNDRSGVVTNGATGIKKYQPAKEDIGKSVELHIYENDSTKINNDLYFAKTNAVTITATNVDSDNDAATKITYSAAPNHSVEYNGKNQKFDIDKDLSKVTITTDFDNDNAELDKNKFDFSYNLINGNGVDAGSEFIITATPKDEIKKFYTGTLQFDYKIEKRWAQDGGKDFDFAIDKVYEYTGDKIVPEAGDIKVYDIAGGRHLLLDSDEVIATVDSKDKDPNGNDLTGVSENETWTAKVTLHNVPNYKEESLGQELYSGDRHQGLEFKVVKRNLSNVEVKIDDIAYTGEALVDNDPRFNGMVHLFDSETGKELNLTMGVDYTVNVTAKPTTGTQKYKLCIESKGLNTTGLKEVDFILGDHTFKSEGYELMPESKKYLEEAVDYTGKVAVKDAAKIVYKNKYTGNLLSIEDFKVEVIGTDAGTGKVVITGLRSYTECVETYEFKINPLAVKKETITVQPKVVFNKGYTDASQYAPKVTVKAYSTTNKVVDVPVPESAYKVTYNFKTANIIGEYVLSKVQILDKNFKGGDTVFTGFETLIAKRDFSNVVATAEPASYVYTGGVIKPTLKVMDGNEPLTEGVDYVISEIKEGKNVGTGIAVIKGTGDNVPGPDDGVGIYDKTSTLEVPFEITPAKAEDVKVEWAEGNTGNVYTGSTIKPYITKITLNGNDVTHQFDVVYPETNVNVGKGHVILKPVDGNKNFIGEKDAEFDITARELTGTLKVYDEKGRQYDAVLTRNGVVLVDPVTSKPVTFAYDGEEHRFAKAEFVPSGNYAKFVTEDDYEIVYIDAKYGKTGDAEWVEENGDGYAYIAVIGKGNFKGSDEVTDASGKVFSTVKGAAYKFNINKYEIMKQHVVIADGEYAAGQPVRPNVTVTVGGKTLVENEDYVLDYNAISDLTDGKTMLVKVKGINGYKGVVDGLWGVVKRNMANTQVALGTGKNPSVTVYNSGVKVPASEYTVAYEKDGVTVTAKEDSKYYTGSVFAEYADKPDAKPATPVITGATANGNKVSVLLAGESTGAAGYDYVISTDRDCITNKDYDKVNKNILTTKTDFTYIQQGNYYVYCHAWKRDENGVKKFSDWSNAMPVVVGAITPETPAVTSVSVKGSTVTVKYTAAENAAGYDVVLGAAVKTVAGEKRPVEYGTLVKKNIKDGVVTATFKNVPKGTYYAGLHAFNRTNPENNTKVFSPWSNTKKVTVK